MGTDMEYIYPSFESGRILKKELLWALRDYSYSALKLQYGDYPDGIISGCGIRVEDHILYIAPGIVKCQGFLFLLTTEGSVEYAPTEKDTCLKFRLVKKEELADYTRYITEFALDEQLERQQNEIEICRFKLREGAKLRTDYKDFYDMQTEYDTVDPTHATWAAAGGNTLSREATDFFARKVLECGKAGEGDICFAYFLLQNKEAVNYEILTDYIVRKTGCGKGRTEDTAEAFRLLEKILDGIRRGTDAGGLSEKEPHHRMIIID